MSLLNKIKQQAAELLPDIIKMRRHIHMYPELSKHEKETAAFIIKTLSQHNIPYTTYDGHFGISTDIKGLNPEKKTIALRADMDALPIEEKNEVPYKSKNNGIMHACGHDVHTSALLGAAIILNNLKNEFEGTIRLIFQPSEEVFPGGALLMIKDGVLKNPDVQVIFGQHVMPTIDAGKVGITSGMAMASTDEIYITVKGKGGHGATPDLNTDPVVIAANLILTLQQIVSRKAPPAIPTVLSFGRFIANGKTNIIPDEVTIEGTIRTFDEEWRHHAHELIKQTSHHTCAAMGAEAIVNIAAGYPFLVNAPALANRFKAYASAYLGSDNVLDLDLRMTAEDFAYYSQEIPACFYRLGIRNKKAGIDSNIHTATFDIDESVLSHATGLLCWIGLAELGVRS